MKRLLLFDGNSLMHRAYHALPPLTSPKGELVNAVYGFFSILFSTLSQQRPDYLAVAFDVAGPTFRDKLFDQYKAKRVKPPQTFYDQIPLIKFLLKIMEVPALEKKGYEADDLIGSASRLVARQHPELEIMIVTSDQDSWQLIGPRVKVLSFQKGIKLGQIWGAKEVRQNLGFGPEKIIDFKALRGDPSDNIPGVSGIGAKTATHLIQRYGGLKEIYRHLSEFKPVWREKLVKGKDLAKLSFQLAKIKCDLKIKLSLAQARLHDFDQPRVEKEFRKLGFKTLIKRLPQSQRKLAQQTRLL